MFVSDNQGEALLCILFSVAVGVCFVLLTVLCCLCWRWKKAKKEGRFAVAKSIGEGGARLSSYAPGGTKETEGLLSPGMAQNSSGGRTYSSPRLIRAEYARGANAPSGANTPSSASNANVVGLYLSQAPKSRWSRASDATVWPLPPSALSAVDGDVPSLSTISRTLPMQEKPLFISSLGNSGRTIVATSCLSPPMPTLFSQNNQTLPSQVHSSFAPASPTDYLFNRQSVINDPRAATVPSASCQIANRDSPRTTSPTSREALLRKPLNDDGALPRSALSYQGRVGVLGHPPQHHSYLGPHQPTSPPIMPAPASSPWPARTSQIMSDQQDMDSTPAGTKDHN